MDKSIKVWGLQFRGMKFLKNKLLLFCSNADSKRPKNLILRNELKELFSMFDGVYKEFRGHFIIISSFKHYLSNFNFFSDYYQNLS